MLSWQRFIPDLIALVCALLVQFRIRAWLLESGSMKASASKRNLLWLALAISSLWVSFSFLFSVPVLAYVLPTWDAVIWLRGLGMAWAAILMGIFLAGLIFRRMPEFNPERRRLAQTATAALFAAPFAAVGFGFIQRNSFEVREVHVSVPGLDKDLDGLRLVQLSDIHLSPFLSEREFARAVDMANETRPHLALVTGDLITGVGDPLDACLRQLTRLKADAGVFGCLGNHEIYADAEDYTGKEAERLGMDFLRGKARRLRFGRGELNLAGVDYQRKWAPYLKDAGKLIAPGAFNVLLSHNPDVFPVAAGQGYDLTISGHTHGGQVNFEILSQNLNIARFFTPYVHGLYRQGPRAVYVSRGIGTVGVPARLGAPPEITLLRLCAT